MALVDKQYRALLESVRFAAAYATATNQDSPVYYETFFRVMRDWSACQAEHMGKCVLRLHDIEALLVLSDANAKHARDYAERHQYTKKGEVLAADIWQCMFMRGLPEPTNISVLILSAMSRHLTDLAGCFPDFKRVADLIGRAVRAILSEHRTASKKVRACMEDVMRHVTAEHVLVGFGILPRIREDDGSDEDTCRKRKRVTRSRAKALLEPDTLPTDWLAFDKAYQEYTPALIDFSVPEEDVKDALPLTAVHHSIDVLTHATSPVARVLQNLSKILLQFVHSLEDGDVMLRESEYVDAATAVLTFMQQSPAMTFFETAHDDSTTLESACETRPLLLAWFAFFQQETVMDKITERVRMHAEALVHELIACFSNWLLCDMRRCYEATCYIMKRICNVTV